MENKQDILFLFELQLDGFSRCHFSGGVLGSPKDPINIPNQL